MNLTDKDLKLLARRTAQKIIPAFLWDKVSPKSLSDLIYTEFIRFEADRERRKKKASTPKTEKPEKEKSTGRRVHFDEVEK